jgi:predicted metal-dependent hydrolase
MQSSQVETVSLPHGVARVEWRRSVRARRVSLRIDARAGNVVITLPPRAERRAGMALLMTHANWVRDRLAALPDATRLVDGGVVPIGGVAHRIRHVPTERGVAWLAEGELCVAGAPEFLARRVTDFLRTEAYRRLSAIVAVKSAKLGIAPRRVTIKDTRSRWGSCAPSRSLAFCWRLVMAPQFVQDYVVAHEVAHLRHMNHGPHFWELLATLTPHIEAARTWLRVDGARLMRVGFD